MGWGWKKANLSSCGFLLSLYCSVHLEHLLNPVALAVTLTFDYRKTMPKLDSLDYICINWINTQFQAIYCLLPQANNFSFLPGFLISVLISAFWGFSWFCFFVCHQRLISTPMYLRQVVAWGVLVPVHSGTDTRDFAPGLSWQRQLLTAPHPCTAAGCVLTPPGWDGSFNQTNSLLIGKNLDAAAACHVSCLLMKALHPLQYRPSFVCFFLF